jgi:signal peptidase II
MIDHAHQGNSSLKPAAAVRFPSPIRTGLWILFLFIMDQMTKTIVSLRIPYGQTVVTFLGFGLTYKTNRGLAFHFLEPYRWIIVILTLFCLAAIPLMILLYRFYRTRHQTGILSKMALIFLISGILGNSYDRLVLGYVRDFIRWPGPGVPNLADLYADIALVCLFAEWLRICLDKRKLLMGFKSFQAEKEEFKQFIDFSKLEILSFLVLLKK